MVVFTVVAVCLGVIAGQLGFIIAARTAIRELESRFPRS